jgi:hypothetical protein
MEILVLSLPASTLLPALLPLLLLSSLTAPSSWQLLNSEDPLQLLPLLRRGTGGIP